MKRLCILVYLSLLSLLSFGQSITINGITYRCGYTWEDIGGKRIKKETASVQSVSPTLSGAVTVPSTITYKGNSVPVTVIEARAFSDCSQLTSISISPGIIFIGEYAFEHCTGLTSIKLPVKIEETGNGVFYNCSSLVSVELPTFIHPNEGIKHIGSNYFYGCSNLVYVKIPAGITRLDSRSFAGCESLTDIFCFSTKVPAIVINAFEGLNLKKIKVHVPNAVLSQYQSSAWNEFKSVDSNMTRPHLNKQNSNATSYALNSNTRSAIDMGGSVEWANMNLESKDIRDVGGLFTSSGDAARAKWGGGWRLPTEEEFNELLYGCEQILHSRINCVEFISGNGNRLILPLLKSTNVTYDGVDNIYWISDTGDGNGNCIRFWEAGYIIGGGMITTRFERKKINYFKVTTPSGYYRGPYKGLIRPVRTKGNTNAVSANKTDIRNNNSLITQTMESNKDNNVTKNNSNPSCYFVFGTRKELSAQEIISENTVNITSSNKEYFTKANKNIDKEIKLYSRTAEILTSHPTGSYEFIKDDNGYCRLRINDPDKFWSTSNYLVIVVK